METIERDPLTTLTPEQRKLVRTGLPLVYRVCAEVAWKYRPRVQQEELLAPATIALHEAALAYRQDKHPDFAQYARHHVRGRALDSVRKEHFSFQARVEHAMERIDARLTSHLVLDVDMFSASEEELVDASRRAGDDVIAAAFYAGTLETRSASPEEIALALSGQKMVLTALLEGIGTLGPWEQEVVNLMYEGGMGHREVAKYIGVDESTVYRRHRSALGKLRRFLEARGITRESGLLELGQPP